MFRQSFKRFISLAVCLSLLCCVCGVLAETMEKTEVFSKPTAVPTVSAEPPPQQVQEMVALAVQELDALNKEKLPRTNKYSIWYFQDQRRIGWCATFVAWCAEEVGMEMVKEKTVAENPIPDVFFPKEAKVILQLNAFKNAQRTSIIPKPGYAVIYGVIGGTPATHIGMVETVRDLGDGTYEITTLEGNVSDTIKRFCIRYNPTPKRKHHNMSAVPVEERIVEDAQYKLQKDNWYIEAFGATW